MKAADAVKLNDVIDRMLRVACPRPQTIEEFEQTIHVFSEFKRVNKADLRTLIIAHLDFLTEAGTAQHDVRGWALKPAPKPQ